MTTPLMGQFPYSREYKGKLNMNNTMITGELRHPSGCVLKIRRGEGSSLWHGRFYAVHDIDRGQSVCTRNMDYLLEFLEAKVSEEKSLTPWG